MLDELTQPGIDASVTMLERGWPQLTDFPRRECLTIVLSEEWEHRAYADRDLDQLA